MALDVGAERLLDGAGRETRRSAILVRAAVLVCSRMVASWVGEKDHSWYCDDCRYRASSVAMAAAGELGYRLALRPCVEVLGVRGRGSVGGES